MYTHHNSSPNAGSYASWFTTQPAQLPESPTPSPLMNAITFVVSALPHPALCLSAANALRDLCDANRTALAPHISAFGELHAGLTGIPVRYRGTFHSHLCADDMDNITGDREGEGTSVYC